LVNQLDDIVKNKRFLQDTPQVPMFRTILLQHIGAVVYLSKGMTRFDKQGQDAEIFKRIMQSVVGVMYALNGFRDIQERVTTYLHRMIDLLDEQSISQIFPPIISQLFSQANEIPQVRELVSLLNQLVQRQKTNSFNIANELFMPILMRAFTLIDKGEYTIKDTRSEDYRLKAELHKNSLILVMAIATDCVSVFSSPSMSYMFFGVF